MNQVVADEIATLAPAVAPIEVMNKEAAVIVFGEQMTDFPKDLYIPPDALKVFLETFQGPLDLLLYLIKKQNIDILDIPIAEITRQYVKYVELMQELRLDLAAEYLVMAAMLAEIKSRLLLPRQTSVEPMEEGDPRAELVRRLQEYERYKQAAEDIDALPRLDRDVFLAQALVPAFNFDAIMPDVALEEVLKALTQVMARAKLHADHQVRQEVLSIRERMSAVLFAVNSASFVEFTKLFKSEEGRMGVVVTLIAILELIRQSVLELVQSEPFAPIYVKAVAEG